MKNLPARFLTCAALIIAVGNGIAWCADNEPEAPEVQVNSASVLGLSAVPLVHLAQALQKDKTSPRFRLNWSFVGGGAGGSLSTALYDRKAGTVKLFSTSENFLGKSYRNFLYSGITDEIIIQLAEKHRGDEETITDLAFIDNLPNGKDLGGSYVSYAEKNKPEKKAVRRKGKRK